MSNLKTPDFLIIGGGIIGITLSLELKKRNPSYRITLLEKEKECGAHASGRNSGVLHAGFYYSSDSLKAKFTREGNKLLKEYCQENGLRVKNFGKLVVAQGPEDLPNLMELKLRGEKNQVKLEEISEKEAKKIEPRVKTFQKALFSPNTSTVSPKEVMNSLLAQARGAGIDIQNNTTYIKQNGEKVLTNQGSLSPGYLINAAGLYADKIAKDYSFARNYRILPFKGLYLYGNSKERLSTNIYPVPNLNHPFLGVHFTVTVDEEVKIGPTAIPAFWRENYKGFENFNFSELFDVVFREGKLLIKNSFNFRSLAWKELKKYYKRHLIKLASNLVEDVKFDNFKVWGKPGIRAQLLNTDSNELEMDFRYEGDKHSFHILNAVSPAFTCAMPFSGFLADEIGGLLS